MIVTIAWCVGSFFCGALSMVWMLRGVVYRTRPSADGRCAGRLDDAGVNERVGWWMSACSDETGRFVEGLRSRVAAE